MLNHWQTTIKSPIYFSGKGLHSGRVVKMTLKPAPINHGIVFFRSDIPGSQPILARASEVRATVLSTSIGEGAGSVSTIEHLMAAFSGLGITNVAVHVDAPELPIMDGSAGDFVRGLLRVGIHEQGAPALAYRLKRRLVVQENDKELRLEPANRQRVFCSIEFRSQVIGQQNYEYDASRESFLSIADSRTFCHLSDVQAMRERGLALGGGFDNAIVVTETEVLNESGLRSSDEFVRHKLLDLIGDFSLLGAPLLADIYARKSGHALHAKALQILLADPKAYLEEYYPASREGILDQGLPAYLPQLLASYA